MKLRIETLVRTIPVLLIFLLVWSVWRSAAQNETGSPATSPPAVATNAGATTAGAEADTELRQPLPTPQWIESLAQRAPVLKRTLWGNELWKYLFSLVYIFLAFYVSKLLDYLTRVWLRKLAEKTQTKFDDLLLELLNGPVKVVAFIIFLRIGLDIFDWPEVVQVVLAKGFTIIVAISLTYMVLKFIDLIMGY
ncbi:MAG: hypothetical protein KJ070_16440 [Verrucomicrobia bacterium]|nr:hypothetical protein [Verrucomicrobiota bacterium]